MLTLGELKYLTDTNGKEPKEQALEILIECFRRNGKLLLCGNGGSASDCEHIVGELMKGMCQTRRVGYDPLQGALPAISLVSQTSLITAIGNDIGYDWVFAQQVLGYGRKGDVLMAISTSGGSTNVLRALELANTLNMQTIGLTGYRTYEFDALCKVVISCPGDSAAEVQEQHIKVYHELCARLEEEFFR